MMARGFALLLVLTAGCIVVACGRSEGSVSEQESQVDMRSIIQDLRAVSKARILLGHQSVGRNILAGLDSLAEDAGVPLRILEVTGAPPEGAGIFHSNVGRNGDPDSKCEMFAQLLTAYGRPHYDIAMMKFCYVDLGRDTPLEVAAMLDRYSQLVENIRSTRPEVQLVHVTIPLRADPPGVKTKVKRIIGYPTWEDGGNILRNVFNDALRDRYAGEPLFDLAAVESTLPDGTRSSFEHEGSAIYTLANMYTKDGGHLNELAQRRAAIAFVRSVADALESSRTGSELEVAKQ